MGKLPKICLIDTNVPKKANSKPDDIPDMLTLNCVVACQEAIEHILTKKGRLVIDNGDEIFDEYKRQLSMSGQPGIGDKFMKWVHTYGWNTSVVDRVAITKNGDSYAEFPKHRGLRKFDPSDRKFIAVANKHSEKPPILQGTDSKWWKWKDPLDEVGITVVFLCSDYVEEKCNKKLG